jgi:hypothetical protein
VVFVKPFFVGDVIPCELRLWAPLGEKGGFFQGVFGSRRNGKEKKTKEDA